MKDPQTKAWVERLLQRSKQMDLKMDRNNKKATEEKELGTFTSIKTALFSQQIATRSEIH